MTIEYHRPWLADYQLDALFNDERYGVVEASTKAGKTVSCLVWLTEQAMQGKDGRNYWWVAPILPQAKIAYRRLKRMMPTDLYTANETEVRLTLANGATIWFKGADNPDSLYGEDVYAAVIDEASRCKEEAWHAIRSTLTATRGPVRIIGNVRGRKNWAYAMGRRALAGEPNMHYAKITANDAVKAGILAPEEVEDARNTLPPRVFDELYMAEASEDGQNPFGITAIRRNIAELSSGEPVAWGWDLAKSTDWTWGIALDKNGDCCRSVRFQKPWEETIVEISRLTGNTDALIDSTGVGDPIVARLQHTLGRNIEGYLFTSGSKQQLMEGLAVSIQQDEVSYPQAVADELEMYEYEYTQRGVRYSAPEGYNDDGVCALALAVRKWNELRRYQPEPLVRPYVQHTARQMVKR